MGELPHIYGGLSERVAADLERREKDIERLMKENAELRAQLTEVEDELNAYRRLYSPELMTPEQEGGDD
jgi:hypothetical protein